jgi:hypothetical protein
VAFHPRLSARPDGPPPNTYFRVRHDKVDKVGRVTLRHLSRLHHIGVGRAYIGEPVRLLVANQHIRVIREVGSLLRELTLAPTRDTNSSARCPRRPETSHWLGFVDTFRSLPSSAVPSSGDL